MEICAQNFHPIRNNLTVRKRHNGGFIVSSGVYALGLEFSFYSIAIDDLSWQASWVTADVVILLEYVTVNLQSTAIIFNDDRV